MGGAGCGGDAEKEAVARPMPGPSFAGDPVEVRGLRVPARVGGGGLQLGFGSSFRSRFWPGVNLGSTVPGTRPGEVAATRADYDRWLVGMGDVGVRAVRVYTILRPAFYDALVAYNRRPARAPIYAIHGVWIPEEEFVATGDAYTPAVAEGFREEIADAVRVVHGDADLPERPGHAGGRYRSDISPWLLAWSLGVEWDPRATDASDRKNRDRPAYRGRFVTTTGKPTPMEGWMASMLDYAAALEAGRGWSRPVTFTNWVTADPLRHGEEPLDQEDLVSIDATHLRATERWPGGFFASYHVYPYYPDFLRLDPDYANARRARDRRRDPYSGYLRALRAHHGRQPVMITEFGVPSSNGLAHLGPLGRDQVGHSETRAGQIDADLLQDIREEGYAGGILFEWVDEWFKHTWDTSEYEPVERRHLWRNVLTNEEHFGVIASEAGPRPVALPDGNDSEWARNGSEVIASAAGGAGEVRAAKDEAYLHLRFRVEAKDWRERPLVLGLDVRPGGNRGLPGHPGVHPEADVAVTVGPGRRAKIEQAAWTDPILRARAGSLGMDGKPCVTTSAANAASTPCAGRSNRPPSRVSSADNSRKFDLRQPTQRPSTGLQFLNRREAAT